jgi:dephospho-CoA kinase
MAFINDFFEKNCGFRILISSKIPRIIRKEHSTGPVYVEFFGPSGVGKSALFHAACKYNKNKWITLSRFVKSIPCRKQKDILEKQETYNFLATIKVNNIAQLERCGTDKLSALNYCYKELKKDAIASAYNKKLKVVADEGLFSIFFPALQELYEKSVDEFVKLTERRAIVYCYAPAETILERRKQRNKKRDRYFLQSDTHPPQKQLADLSEERNNFISIVSHFTPVLYIDTSDAIKDNIKKINSFIDSLAKDSC